MTTVHFLGLSLGKTQCGSFYPHTTVSLLTPDVWFFYPSSNFPTPAGCPAIRFGSGTIFLAPTPDPTG